MLLSNKKVAIIGAGPVGLMMARLLQKKGIEVNVYERDSDPTARVWGGTLDLHQDSGQKAMKEAGLLEQYFRIALPMGRIIADQNRQVLFSKGPDYDQPEINRTTLRSMLLESLSSGTVVWNRKFFDLEDCNNNWVLRFDGEPDAVADLVIGANGGMSKVRKWVTDSEVDYTGTYIIQGEISDPELYCPEFCEFCSGNILMTANGGINLVVNPKNNGAMSYAVTFMKPEHWVYESELNFQDKDLICAFLADMFAGWDKRYQRLFRATTSFVGLPSRMLSLNKLWSKHSSLPVTLIGDAAHIMPPFAGQGVNTGMMDALVLTENLTNGKFGSIAAAINDYEQQMFIYAGAAQSETSKNEWEMHQTDFTFQKRFAG